MPKTISKRAGERALGISNAIYFFAAISLSILSLSLFVISGYDIYQGLVDPAKEVSIAILDAIGLIIIAIAIFDVGKYILEEEVSRNKELRRPDEARKTLTKFVVIIFIAMSLETLVYTFIAGKQDIKLLIYPSFLLIATILLMIGLGIYQRLSISVEDMLLDERHHDKDPFECGTK